jgi:eukaryotic-like serine/threonine-protein kinase
MSDLNPRTAGPRDPGGGRTMAFVIGGLIVVIAVIAFLVYGGTERTATTTTPGSDTTTTAPAPSPSPSPTPAPSPAPAPAPAPAPGGGTTTTPQ